MIVKEIFGPTIQGEGTHTGTIVMFLRLSGCNKWSGKPEHKDTSICHFCDTDFLGGENLTTKQIIKKLKGLSKRIKHLVISGGEPCLQLKNDIVEDFVSAGYLIHLETNGTKNIDSYFNKLYHVTMSPKQPLLNTELKRCHDLKILFPYIHKDITARKFDKFICQNRYLQPIYDKWRGGSRKVVDELYNLRDWKLSLQTHKMIGAK